MAVLLYRLCKEIAPCNTSAPTVVTIAPTIEDSKRAGLGLNTRTHMRIAESEAYRSNFG